MFCKTFLESGDFKISGATLDTSTDFSNLEEYFIANALTITPTVVPTIILEIVLQTEYLRVFSSTFLL